MRVKEAGIGATAYYLPQQILDNDQLASLYPDWTAEKILDKTGIHSRHIAAADETAGDMAVIAARRLFRESALTAADVDFIILATQSPDYYLPTTACIIQERLGIPTTAGALDINLGCSAYIYGLALAKGLIAAQVAQNVLLLTAETYSKFIHPLDKSTRTVFGDGAAATWICPGGQGKIGKFDLGTDGSGAGHLIVPAGGARLSRSAATAVEGMDDNNSVRSRDNVFMDGQEIFTFAIREAPKTVNSLLSKTGLDIEDIDLFVFHQANKFMLDFLRKCLKLPQERFYVNMADTGNTVSASIPIALKRAGEQGLLHPGAKVMLVGFGVGLSWGSVIIEYGGEENDQSHGA